MWRGCRRGSDVSHLWIIPGTAAPTHPGAQFHVPALGRTGSPCSPSTCQRPEPKFSQPPANHSILESWRGPPVAQAWNGTGSSAGGLSEGRSRPGPGPSTRSCLDSIPKRPERPFPCTTTKPGATLQSWLWDTGIPSQNSPRSCARRENGLRRAGPPRGAPRASPCPAQTLRRGAVWSMELFSSSWPFPQGCGKLGAGKAGSGPGGCLGMCGSAHLSLKCRLGGRDGSAGKF